MKIGFFTDSFRPYTSGVVRSIETYSRELTALGHTVYTFAPNYPLCQPEDKVFRYFSISSPTNKDFTLAIPFSLYLKQTIQKTGIEVIHTHSPFLLGRLGARHAKRNKIPLVFTYHTLYDQYVHYIPIVKDLAKKLVRKITLDYCNLCDLVIAPTKVVGDYLAEGGVYKPIEILPTGIEIKEFANLDRGWLRRTYGIGENKKVLLHVGRLGAEKNVDFLLQATAGIIKKVPEACLVLVGTGPKSADLKQLASDLGISNHVLFVGFLPREDVIKAYGGADLFVFASLTETQGIVLGEAKAAGLPVVAVKANGASEMVKTGNDGILTELNLEEFQNTVVTLLNNHGLRRNFSDNSLQNLRDISSQACAEKMAGCYYSLIKKN
ncbi:MAG: glycosyltransferase family 4 protein [Syntrophomonadaceae bacterium]|nr:glycosyltransferase family 4 protein [Syntrophomonadaceae bacterium]